MPGIRLSLLELQKLKQGALRSEWTRLWRFGGKMEPSSEVGLECLNWWNCLYTGFYDPLFMLHAEHACKACFLKSLLEDDSFLKWCGSLPERVCQLLLMKYVLVSNLSLFFPLLAPRGNAESASNRRVSMFTLWP